MVTEQPLSSSPRRDVFATLSSSFRSQSPLAGQLVAQDIAECSSSDEDDGNAVDDDEDLEDSHGRGQDGYRRRLSGVAYGTSRPVFSNAPADEPVLTPAAEASLLRDNHVLPPKNPEHAKSQTAVARLYRRLFSTKIPQDDKQPSSSTVSELLVASEATPLLGPGGQPVPPAQSENALEEQWESAVASGKLRTTWQREVKTLGAYSAPLVVTFVLQYSINVASIFAVGKIGKMELGAVSLANMSAAITCLAPFQGLATGLDTLCAQAYGSGHKHLVGLQLQRMTYFLLTLTPFVILIWLNAEAILSTMIPEPEAARLAGTYLRVMIFAIPGIIIFECGKRFTQAQGMFQATTYVLLLVAPLNAFLMWLLVWHFELGFIGAPISITITENLLPLFLFLYVKFVGGTDCWGGFTKKAFHNWWPMIRLALPGMIMVEAEWLAFEILTLLASRFGADLLAAQSVLITLSSIAYQLPFPVSIAASTRVANLMGAGLVSAAKTSAKVTFVLSLLVGMVNFTIATTLRYKLPLLFTNDANVIEIVAQVLPIVAAMQVLDGLSAGAHGILRGVGKQAIGGPANLCSYYLIAMPICIGLAFGLDWKLQGLWVGVTIGLLCVSAFEYAFLVMADWDKAAREAEMRNAAG